MKFECKHLIIGFEIKQEVYYDAGAATSITDV